MLEFHVVPGSAVSRILESSRARVMSVVTETYRLHQNGATMNPASQFLRIPDRPDSRVIALPAYVGGHVDKIGIKWIGSFPGNVRHGSPRASAVLVLNDVDTGYPIACLEAGGISAARTAASAAVAATALMPARPPIGLSFVGAGVIARNILDYFVQARLPIEELSCFDVDERSADCLIEHARTVAGGLPSRRASSLADALRSDVVVFATTAATPYVPTDSQLRAGQLLLNISLRDLPAELLLASNNIVDDVEHCLRAQTSPHLAEQLSGSREFINGTLGSLLEGSVALDPGRPTVFSPFGLGALDVAVGHMVLGDALREGLTVLIAGFFGETRRW
jgi:2,3-diaminopropionate biosynthesis protein SbnB